MKKNELTINTNDTRTMAIATAMNSSLADFGYESTGLKTDENGNTMLVVKDADNKGETVEVPVELTEETKRNMESFCAFIDFDKLATLYKCYHSYRLKAFSEDMGFKSVGEMASVNFGLKAGTINQYYRIADKFLDCTGDKPIWKYEWLKGVSVTNLNQCLSLIDKCDSVQDFKEKYIDTDKLHLRKPLSKVKEELDEIAGKTKEPKKQEKQEEAGKPNGEISTLTAWAMVREAIASAPANTIDLDPVKVMEAIELIEGIVNTL